MADLGVAHLAVGEPDVAAAGREGRVRVALPELVEDRRLGQGDGVAGPGLGQPPAVEDHQARATGPADSSGAVGSAHGLAAAQIAGKSPGSSEAPPTRPPSISGCENSSAALSGFTEPP